MCVCFGDREKREEDNLMWAMIVDELLEVSALTKEDVCECILLSLSILRLSFSLFLSLSFSSFSLLFLTLSFTYFLRSEEFIDSLPLRYS